VTRASGEKVTVLSTVQGLGSAGFEDDASTAEAALAALPPEQRDQVTLVDGYLTPTVAIETLARCRAVVTQRLHPAIFALGHGVPAALLLGGDKVAVLDGAGVGDLVCRTPEDPKARARALEAALGVGAPRGPELRTRLDPVVERAAKNLEVLRAVLDETPALSGR
jgi:polysaccharide pyruvyl transferase WcaK-like protein